MPAFSRRCNSVRHLLVTTLTRWHALATTVWERPRRHTHDRAQPRRHRLQGHGGQATAEYALVLLGVAAIALLVLAWAAQSGKIGQLFDAVVDNLIGKVR